MRPIFIGAALLSAALSMPACADESNAESTHLKQLTHCFDHTPFHVYLAEHGTALGSTRQVYNVTRPEQLAVSDGYKLLFDRPGSHKAVARLLLEQVPVDKLQENKKIERGELHAIAQNSAHVRLAARSADGLEVLSMDRSQVESDGILSKHVVFHDASATMATLTMFGMEDHKPVFHSEEELYAYRTGVLSRLGACMLGQAGMPGAPAATPATVPVPVE